MMSIGLHRLLDAPLVAQAITLNPNGIIVTDATAPDNPIVFVNRAFTRNTGFSADEAVGRNCRFLQGTDRDQPGLNVLREAVLRGRPAKALLRNYRKDGSLFWNEVTIQPLFDTLGTITHFVGTQNDVTARVNAEIALREQRNMLDAIYNSAGVGICVVDDEGYFLEVNEALCLMYGYERNELLGQRMTILVPKEDHEVSLQFHRETMAGQRRFKGDWRVIRKDRKQLDVFVTTNVIVYDDASRVMVCTVADVTEIKRARERERAMEAHMQETQRLEGLGVLAGGIAHDFNNLLAGILGHLELANLELDPDSPAHEPLLTAQKAVLRASELTQQLLAYSGRGRIQVQKLDLSRLVREITDLLGVSIRKNATLDFQFAEKPVAVVADGTQVRQVVMNLITNASDALEGKPGRIVLRTGVRHLGPVGELHSSELRPVELAEGDYAIVEVEDSGCGMDEETLRRLFDPFFTTKAKGRGLGLAAVRGIIARHGGAIQVDSEPGRGSRFTVFLPLADEEPLPAQESTAHTATTDQGHTILLVDDDDLVRAMAAKVLVRAGFQVVEAANGEEAIWALERDPAAIDAVATDLTMPGMTGDIVMQRLHAIRPGLPVLLMSGYTEVDIDATLETARDVVFLQKPFMPRKLIKTLRDLIAAAKG